MLPCPRAQVVTRAQHLGAFAALALGATADRMHDGRVQVAVPELAAYWAEADSM